MGSEHLAVGRVGNQSPAPNSFTSRRSVTLQIPIYLLTNGRVRKQFPAPSSFTSASGATARTFPPFTFMTGELIDSLKPSFFSKAYFIFKKRLTKSVKFRIFISLRLHLKNGLPREVSRL